MMITTIGYDYLTQAEKDYFALERTECNLILLALANSKFLLVVQHKFESDVELLDHLQNVVDNYYGTSKEEIFKKYPETVTYEAQIAGLLKTNNSKFCEAFAEVIK